MISATAQIFRQGLHLISRARVVLKVTARSISMPASQREIENTIKEHKVVMYSKSYCPFCKKAKQALKDEGINDFLAIELDEKPDGDQYQDILQGITGGRSVPRVFINGKFIGGGDDTVALAKTGQLKKLYAESK